MKIFTAESNLTQNLLTNKEGNSDLSKGLPLEPRVG